MLTAAGRGVYKSFMTTATASNARRIVSKFNGTCTACKGVVNEGQTVLWAPGVKGVKHVACPTTVDPEVVLTGAMLTARADDLEARLVKFEVQRQDFFAGFNASDAEKPEVCEKCEGLGYRIVEWDSSNTLDFRSMQHTPVRCDAKARISTEHGSDWFDQFTGVEIDGVPCEPVEIKGLAGYKPEYTVRVWGGLTQAHVDAGNALATWELRRHEAELAFDKAYPTYRETLEEIERCDNDLEIRKGDIATVINRGKPYTGTVVFVGESLDFSRPYGTYRNQIARQTPVRVTVKLADGTSKGGAIETAVFVSRTAKFAASK